MRRNRLARRGLHLGLCWALWQLGGCATALSGAAMDWATPGVTPGAVLEAPRHHIGQVVLLAGPILGLENPKEGAILEILGYPTTARGFPDTSEPALGRFFLRYPGYLDPKVYWPGRSIAAAARVEGERETPSNGTVQHRPVLRSLELKLLPEPTLYDSPILIGIGVMGGF